jgi:hypothetical protein
VVPEPALLFLGQVNDRYLDLNLRSSGSDVLAPCRLRGLRRRGEVSIAFSLAIWLRGSGLDGIFPSEEVVLVDRWLVVETVRSEDKVQRFQDGGLPGIVVAD